MAEAAAGEGKAEAGGKEDCAGELVDRQECVGGS